MLPIEATNPEELLTSLIQSSDDIPCVRVDVLVAALGLDAARRLTIIQTNAFIDRSRAIEMMMLNRAVGMLSEVDRLSLNPIPTEVEESNANVSTFETKRT